MTKPLTEFAQWLTANSLSPKTIRERLDLCKQWHAQTYPYEPTDDGSEVESLMVEIEEATR